MRKILLPDKRCRVCGKPFNRKRFPSGKLETTRRYKSHRFCSYACSRTWLAGPHHYRWGGGLAHYKRGYVVVSKTRRGVHRIIMERFIGRPLHQHEIVHHVDGDPSNNAPSNLRAMSQSEHARIHAELQGGRIGKNAK